MTEDNKISIQGKTIDPKVKKYAEEKGFKPKEKGREKRTPRTQFLQLKTSKEIFLADTPYTDPELENSLLFYFGGDGAVYESFHELILDECKGDLGKSINYELQILEDEDFEKLRYHQLSVNRKQHYCLYTPTFTEPFQDIDEDDAVDELVIIIDDAYATIKEMYEDWTSRLVIVIDIYESAFKKFYDANRKQDFREYVADMERIFRTAFQDASVEGKQIYFRPVEQEDNVSEFEDILQHEMKVIQQNVTQDRLFRERKEIEEDPYLSAVNRLADRWDDIAANGLKLKPHAYTNVTLRRAKQDYESAVQASKEEKPVKSKKPKSKKK